jgi:inner membrane protein
VEWEEPYFAFSLADARGLVGTPRVTVDGMPREMQQGGEPVLGWTPTLRVPLHGVKAMKGPVEFAADLELAGTEQLGVAPIGDTNHVELRSTWPSPLFSGQFLPRQRDVAEGGFSAMWDVSSLASRAQAQMREGKAQDVDTLDVSLVKPIDQYRLSDRATKYGVLFVVLTFGASYLVSCAACIGLLTFYLSYVLRSVTRGLGFGAILTALYSAMYGILISEDNALIMGSLLLFAMLAAVMYVTRNVDWYGAEVEAA